jgi:hypothetical protein
VLAAYSTTTEAKTAKVAISATGRIHVRSGGNVNFADQSSDEHVYASINGGASREVRRIGSRLYIKLPYRVQKHSHVATPWLKVDLNTLSKKQYGATLAQLHVGTPSDPTQVLGYLRGVSSKVTKVGTATVHNPTTGKGTSTTHYKGRINLDKAAARKGSHARQAIKEEEQRTGVHTLPIQTWIDHQGRVRRLKTSLPAATGTVTITENLFDFGAPVHVNPPPKSKTTNITNKILRKLGGRKSSTPAAS